MLDEKDDRALEIEARMKAPLEWDSPENCKILDLKETQYGETLRLIKVQPRKRIVKDTVLLLAGCRHFFRLEPMCKAASLLQDQSSVNDYLEIIRTRMKDTTSLVAVSVSSGRVIGTAITRINSHSEKTNTYSRVRIFEGEVLRQIMQLKHAVIAGTNAYEWFGRDKYFRVYILCVHPSYHGKGIDVALLDACVQVAITLEMPAIGGIFTSGADQSMAQAAGFQILSEIRYGRWVVDDRVVFDDPGRGNYTAAFMGMLIPLEEHSKDDQVSSVDAAAAE